MNLRDGYVDYLDPQGLIGSHAHPETIWTGGNQLLETYTGLVLLLLAEELRQEDLNLALFATRQCQPVGHTGIYDKNPPDPATGKRRMDDITHDDLLGVAMGSSLLGLPFHEEICRRGFEQGWFFSNNGVNYYTAHAKPWHQAAYMMVAGFRVDAFRFTLLILSCLGNALFKMDDAGGKRLTWLILEATAAKNPVMSLVYRFWRWRMRKKHGQLSWMFKTYHGESHPYAACCPLDSVYTHGSGLRR